MLSQYLNCSGYILHQLDTFERLNDARKWAQQGATLAEIAYVLGHKTLAMVKRYAHLSERHTAAVVARMNERIFGA